MNPSPRRARLAACALLAAPILALCAPFLFTSRHLVADDFRDYYGPHAQQAREEVRRTGELPRWNVWQYAGTPFLGSGQNNFYYPPNALFLVLPVDRAFGILVAVHLLLAAAGTYRLARSFRLRRDAAVVSGLAFGISFSLIARIGAGHLPHFISACQAPFLLLLIRRAVRRPDAGRLAGLAGGGALSIVAGYPHFVYQLALLCAAFVVRELHARWKEGGKLLPAAGVLAGAAAGALALSSIHLLPMLETASASTRAAASGDLVAPFHDFDLSQLVLLTVPRFFWRSASDPWLLHEKAMYLGILPLVLAGWAFRSRQRAPVFFLGGTALVVLLEALSGRLFAWLPWYGGFRLPERALWIAALCLALLAGFGWDRLREEGSPARKFRGPAAAGLAAIAWALVLGLGFQAREGTIVFLAASGAAIAAVLLAGRWPFVAAAVVALDLGTAGLLEMRTEPPSSASPAPWYDRFIPADRSAFRVLDLQSYKATPVAQGYRLLRGYSHPIAPELAAFYASAWTETMPLLDTLPTGSRLRDVSVLRDLNVRWIVDGTPPASSEWKAVGQHGGRTLYEDPGARPEAFLADGRGTVSFVRPGANRMVVRVTAEQPSTVVVSETWAPGWTAEADGRRLDIGRYRGALLKLDVPSGSSEIRLRYASAGWSRGRWISGLSLLGLLGAALGMRLARLRRQDL